MRQPIEAAWTVLACALVALAPDARAEDCNGNGIEDLEDIASGTSRDCNANAVPDECDVRGVAFELGQSYAAPARTGRLALADLDGDGDLDAVSEARDVFRGNGDGTFENGVALIDGEGRFADSIDAVDLDGDGIPDLLSRAYDEGVVSLLFGAGGGDFGPPIEIPVGEQPRSLVAHDVERDGDPDLVLVTDRGSTLLTLENDGSGTFAPAARSVPAGSRELELADVDGDGWVDAIVPQYGSYEHQGSSVAVLRGGSGGFGDPEVYPVGSGPRRVAATDLDEDGDLDILVLNVFSEEVTVLANRGDGSFDPAVSYAVGREPLDLELADVDSDGHVDVVTCGPTYDDGADNVVVLQGAGDGTFEPGASGRVRGAWLLEVADLDGDGDPDLLTENLNSQDIGLIENPGGRAFGRVEFLSITSSHGWTEDIATGDLDGDGDLDAVVGTTASALTVFQNASHQELAAGCDPFVRGDVNADGTVSISDMITFRRWSFDDTLDVGCRDAMDVDDDDLIDTCDRGDLLEILFDNPGWEEVMPRPFREPGFDPTPLAVRTEGDGCEYSGSHQLLPVGCLRYDPVEAEASSGVVRIENVTAVPGEEVRIPVYLRPSVAAEAVQIVVEYDPEVLEIASGPESLDFSGSFYERFFGRWFSVTYNEGRSTSDFRYGDRPYAYLTAYPEDAVLVAAVLGSFTFPGFDIPPGDEVLVANIRARVSEDAPPDAETGIVPVGGTASAGVGPFGLRTEISHQGDARYVSVLPAVEGAILAIVGDQSFFRGDSNGDGDVDLSDAIFTLESLFIGGADTDCEDAADANDDGLLDVSDAIYTLDYLYLSGPPIPPPGEERGADPTPDGIHCFRTP